ncbi:amidohydrolase [Aureobasidium pullulans]|nr:amidohydrolase [Aureobasidium pullulans]
MTTKSQRIKPWQLPPHKTYIFQNANIVDSERGLIRKECTVKVSNGVFDEVKEGRLLDTQGAIVVDLEGRFLCPGLIDSHVHLMAVPGFEDLSRAFGNPFAVSAFRQPYVCQQMLSRGFTSVRDCGGATYALKEAIEDGVFPGPRLFLSVHALSQTGGHADIRGPHDHEQCCGGANGDLGRICDGVEDCIKATREQIRTGADFIKIMAGGGVTTPTDKLENVQFTAQEVKAITTVAGNADLWVTAHAYTPKSIRHAIENGCKGIEHGNFLDEPTAKLMAERGAFLTPTLVTYAEMNDWPGYLPPESAKKNSVVLEAGIRSLKIASEAGVTICFGTDLLGPLGSAQTREFRIRSEVLSPVDLLRTATVNPARMLRVGDRLGQIKPGFVADLLILESNPLEDITILDSPDKHLFAVMKEGRVHHSRWSKLPVDAPKPVSFIQ